MSTIFPCLLHVSSSSRAEMAIRYQVIFKGKSKHYYIFLGFCSISLSCSLACVPYVQCPASLCMTLPTHPTYDMPCCSCSCSSAFCVCPPSRCFHTLMLSHSSSTFVEMHYASNSEMPTSIHSPIIDGVVKDICYVREESQKCREKEFPTSDICLRR
jgi:hypothetical protein